MFRTTLVSAVAALALTTSASWAEQHEEPASSDETAETDQSAEMAGTEGETEGDGMATVISAEVMDVDGNSLGTVTINNTPSGVALVGIDLSDLPEGEHGIHLHETGDCSADDFSSAGGHIAGEADHGVLAQGGPHPGDMPNASVGSDGSLQQEVFLASLDIQTMISDSDGAAFVVHSGADDYESQPSGDSGDRIACGEFAGGS